jgi:hypothetical protein
VKLDKASLFLTDSSGNTFTSASAAYGWSVPPEQEELEYENTHRHKEVGEPKTVELVPGKTVASLMTAAGKALGGHYDRQHNKGAYLKEQQNRSRGAEHDKCRT